MSKLRVGVSNGQISAKRVRHRRMEQTALSPSGPMRGAITVFIVFHLVAITAWVCPVSFRPISDIREIVRPYILWTGLFQSWDMFAPDPKSRNEFIKAAVMTKGRHTLVFALPRMEDLGYLERYQKERYRKFTENVLLDRNSAVWPDMLRHVARIYNDPSDPPDNVLLIKYQADITPGQDWTAEPKPSIFYDDRIEPEDLR